MEERFETGYESASCYSLLSTTFSVHCLVLCQYITKFANVLRFILSCLSSQSSLVRSIASYGMAAKYDSVIGRNAQYALLSCKPFDWSFSDFTSGKLSLCNTNFGTFHNLSITHAQRQSGLFLCELGLLHLRDQATVLSNGMSLLRSEIDDLILYVCCT